MHAIPTEYGGYLFRSRLEARWSVFFDALGIDYQYEPEGFEIAWSLVRPRGPRKTFRYLPDFYLPDLDMWAEVKARWRGLDASKLIDATAAISERSEGFLILGDLLRWKSARPVLLHPSGVERLGAPEIMASPWPSTPGDVPRVFWSRDTDRLPNGGHDVLGGHFGPLPADIEAALDAARLETFNGVWS